MVTIALTLLLMPSVAVEALAEPGFDPADFSLYENTESKWFVPAISHRVFLGYTTGSRGSWSTGAYLGTLSFDLARGLTADVSLGVAEHYFFSRGYDANDFLGNLMLDWRPTDELRLQLNIGGVIPGEVPDLAR